MLVRLLRPALSLLIVMTVLLGLLYPATMTGVATLVFPRQAAGSLIYSNGQLVGSSLIGQSFTAPKYFWGRPSATTPQPYNALASSGSNLGPLNPALLDQVKAIAKRLHEVDPDNERPIPIDLVSASASGLDPQISPAGAQYQIERVARARGISAARIQALIAAHEQWPLLGLIGERRVNVLELNLALDQQR
jgi:potassium-transporting ATPase KdpC subunit